MNKTQSTRFSESVEDRLASEEEARELWGPTAQEFDRDGPDAAREYLVAEKQRLEEHVQRLINEFNRG